MLTVREAARIGILHTVEAEPPPTVKTRKRIACTVMLA